MIDLSDDFDPDINYDIDLNSITSNNYTINDLYSIFDNNDTMHSLINYNIRSFHSNFRYFGPIVEKCKPKILVLTETWFTSEYQEDIPNYDSHHSIRTSRPSGGVTVYVDSHYDSKKVCELSYVNTDIEVCTVECKLDTEVLYVISIYRPHSGTIDNLTSELERILNSTIFRNRRCIITGDLNLNLLIENSSHNRFIELLNSHHFFSLITEPTRFCPNDTVQPTLLDHIWYNTPNLVNSGVVPSFDFMDHRPTFFQFPSLETNACKKDDNIKITFRLNNDENKNSFREKLCDFNWASIASPDVSIYAKNISDSLDAIYCSCFPLKTKLVPKRKAINPWFTPKLRELIRLKSFYCDLLKTGVITKAENNRFKNSVKSIIDKTKLEYYKNLFKKSMGNARATWKNLNDVMGRINCQNKLKCIVQDGEEIVDDKKIADAFNNYFYNIPLELDASVPPSSIDPLHFITTHIGTILDQFEPCTPPEIISIIGSQKITKQGRDSVPTELIVANKDIISVTLSDLFNQCMTNGVFPDSYKIGRIVPILKKGDPKIVSNYRPISILPVFSKILEKIIHKRLVMHLAVNNVLSPSQFGFRSGMSTVDAIVRLTECLYDALNNYQSSISVFIDYSKAFDTVNHAILLRKLDRYGVRGPALNFFKSYLSNRQQFVAINDSCSERLITNISVPQGSVVGPLLYIIYVNEIQNLSQNFIATSFADDCTLCFIDQSMDNLISTCNYDLNIFKAWSDANRLTINIEKKTIVC